MLYVDMKNIFRKCDGQKAFVENARKNDRKLNITTN